MFLRSTDKHLSYDTL